MQTKTLPLVEAKIAGDGNGAVEGYASTFGNVDSYGDTIDPGAYAATLSSFLRDGFVAWGHDWSFPVAMPTSAVEDRRGLYLTAAFHSDPEAQRARSIVAERLAGGKTMGLSIGYEALAWEMRKVETPYRGPFGELTDQVRALTKIKLFEVSLVTVPADEQARVATAKGHGLSFDDHSERVRVAVAEWVARVRSGSELRAAEGKVGRPISEARRTRMASVSTQVRSAADEIDAMLEETAPPKGQGNPVGLDPLTEFVRFQQFVARRNGVAIGGV